MQVGGNNGVFSGCCVNGKINQLTCTACGNAIEPSEPHLFNPQTLDRVHVRGCVEVITLQQQADDGRWQLVEPKAKRERAA